MPDSKTWVITPTTRLLEHDSVTFLTPNNFTFVFFNVELVPLLANLCGPCNEFVFKDGTRVGIEEGKIIVRDTDIWVNKGFIPGDYVCDVEHLTQAIAKYVGEHWPMS